MVDDHSFTPSHASLVDHYLRAKIDDGSIGDHAMASLFHDADVCSARPHDLVRDHTAARVPCRDAADGEQWFFFSPARFDGNSTTRRSRAVDGTNKKESWHSEGSAKPVEGSENGGCVQKFSYHVKTATGAIEKPGWIMAEYTFNNTRPGDVVLCKVYRSPRGPGRSNASSSSSAKSSAGIKRKAADQGEDATTSTRPRLDVADEDDVMLFAEDVERDLLSHHDHDDMAPESGEPQEMTLQEMETFMMADEEDDGTMLRVPDGEDPVAFYMRVMDSIGADDQQPDADAAISNDQQQDADIQTARGLLSEYDMITALATGVTLDELLLGVPSMSCPHPGGAALGVLCT